MISPHFGKSRAPAAVVSLQWGNHIGITVAPPRPQRQGGNQMAASPQKHLGAQARLRGCYVRVSKRGDGKQWVYNPWLLGARFG